MTEIPITDARDDLSTLLNRVAFGQERLALTRHGHRVAFLISLEDLALLEALEDERDLSQVEAALSNPENHQSVPWEEVKSKLNL